MNGTHFVGALTVRSRGRTRSARAKIHLAGPGASRHPRVKRPRAWLLALGIVACDDSKPAPAPATSTAVKGHVTIIMAPPGDEPLSVLVPAEAERAKQAGRDLLIYVGAPWCEPCTRFHEAAARGELDEAFPTLTLLELDRDRDEERLRAAGCITKLIPLFARPNSDGGCDLSRSMTGSVKGPGAIANITPRLRKLLAK